MNIKYIQAIRTKAILLFFCLFSISNLAIAAPLQQKTPDTDKKILAANAQKLAITFTEKCALDLSSTELLTVDERKCLGEPFAKGVEDLRTKDPIAEAQKAVKDGKVLFLEITHAWAGSLRPGIICLIDPPDSLIESNIFFSDAIGGRGDVAWRDVYLNYAARYNQALVNDPQFPYPDLCRQKPEQTDSTDKKVKRSNYLSISDWIEATRNLKSPSSLSSAARMGDVTATKQYLSDGANPNVLDDWDMSALSWAAMRGDADLVKILINAGADPNLSCEECPTVLNIALIGGNANAVSLLLEAGAEHDQRSKSLQPIDRVQPRNFTNDMPLYGRPISVATALGRSDLMLPILSFEKDKEALGEAALIAVHQKSSGLLKLLLEYGADANHHQNNFANRKSAGLSLVQIAAANGLGDIVRMLIPKVARVESRSRREEEAWRAANAYFSDDILILLVLEGHSLHRLSGSDFDKLIFAVKGQDRSTVSMLIEKSLSEAAKLYDVIKAGDLEKTRQLIEESGGLMRGHGESALTAAIFENQHHIVEWLLSHGMDPDIPVHPMVGGEAKLSWHSLFVDTLFKNRPRTANTLLAFNIGNTDIIKSVIERSNIEYLNSEWDSPLRNALFDYRKHTNLDAIELALEFGGRPDKTGLSGDHFLQQLCFWTARQGTGVLEYYLKLGYRPRQVGGEAKQARFPSDDMALNTCIQHGKNSVQLLLDYGADPNQPDSIDRLPLEVAMTRLLYSEDLHMITALLEAGGNPNVFINDGMTVLDYAISRSNAKVRNNIRGLFKDAAALLRKYGGMTKAELITAEKP
ncbi:ankyrin repeat domain-containing protein [Parasphingorhabdus sp. DH2-15]|uniref:ankyrin repeat domain-containing protein n=1 Tax=Parasphingorhabdus sp. DH2-15 TaxID=3444112 RepID=UPI003F689050